MTLSLNSASISQILEPILQGLICSVCFAGQEDKLYFIYQILMINSCSIVYESIYKHLSNRVVDSKN